MATLAPPSPPRSPTRMPRRWARKVERYCCLGVTYFPLVFVYTITTWAIWVETRLGSEERTSDWVGRGSSILGLVLYTLLNWSYTTAVFTNPGSTTNGNYGDYSSLPVQAPPVATSFTVKSNGELRFCKKCQSRKPDRAHHCSTCGKCVLKMDHHCPWLATCVGLRNYKAFLLFLIYTTLFCFLCFAVSADWVYSEVVQDGEITESLMPVHYVMLAVIAGIIGLVLAGFTGWHILLASRGQTTIECLEKTRYLSPLRKAMQNQHIAQHQGDHEQSYGQQLKDIHTNALPGVTRPEEGEIEIGRNNNPYSTTGSYGTGHQSYDALERFRARERYEEYLDEQDSEKLPSAFDLGWQKNFLHLFGSRRLLWPFPVCTTIGNGWSWEPSPKWLDAREKIARDREEQNRREAAAGWGAPIYDVPEPAGDGAGRHYVSPPRPERLDKRTSSKADRILGRDLESKADRILGRSPAQYSDGEGTRRESRRESNVSMKTLRPRDEDYEVSEDEDDEDLRPSLPSRNSSGRWGPAGMVGASGLLRQDSNSGREGGWKKWDDEADGGVD